MPEWVEGLAPVRRFPFPGGPLASVNIQPNSWPSQMDRMNYMFAQAPGP